MVDERVEYELGSFMPSMGHSLDLDIKQVRNKGDVPPDAFQKWAAKVGESDEDRPHAD